MIEHASNSQLQLIFDSLKGQITSLAQDAYGCRVLQKAIECMTPKMHSSILKELKPVCGRFMFDTNGNHVV